MVVKLRYEARYPGRPAISYVLRSLFFMAKSNANHETIEGTRYLGVTIIVPLHSVFCEAESLVIVE